jgi:hypothetical protein
MKLRTLLASAILLVAALPAFPNSTLVTYSGSGDFVWIDPGTPWAGAATPLPYTVNFSFILPTSNAPTTGEAKLSADGIDVNYSGSVGWHTEGQDAFGLGFALLTFGDIHLYFEVWDQPWPTSSVQNLLNLEGLRLYTTYKGTYDDIGAVSLVSVQQVPERGATLALLAIALVPLLVRRRRAS